MNLMSSGLQKVAGDRMRHFLAAMTSTRFKSVATGVTITSIIQSSSATTVMVVGFVNAGLLLLNQAIGVIMGANIGTTVTAWMISLLGFKADISILAVPLMAIGFILSIAKSERRRNISELIIGFSLLFLGLSLMKESVPDLQKTPEVLEFIKGWTQLGFGSVLIFLLFGTIMTLVLQSSSATMALTLIMMSLGWIPFHMAAAMVLGENIGTTITANIAASVAKPNAKRAALAHTLFNVFGVIWALALFNYFTDFVGWIISCLGLPNPADMAYGAVIDPTSPESTSALYGLSMFHTLFNLFNTCILIWFIPQIERIVTTVIKDKPKSEDDLVKLKYISAAGEEYKWIYDNCYKYGIIYRYPADKTEQTDVSIKSGTIHYDHFRYVGKAAAAVMHENNWCLEEFIAKVATYTYDGEHLTVTSADGVMYEMYYFPAAESGATEVKIPEGAEYTVSGDNIGGYIVTLTIK